MAFDFATTFWARSLVVLALGTTSCAGDGSAEPPSGPRQPRGLIIGLDADPALVSQIDRIELRVTNEGGDALFAETMPAPLPTEVELPMLESDLLITIEAEAFDGAGAPLLTRSLTTRYPGAGARLGRLRFNDECIPGVTGRDVSCPGATCVAGVCRPAFVSTTDLAVYDADWAAAPESPCADVGQGDVDVTIGHDVAAFSPMAERAVLIPEPGNQGGTHIWLAVQVHNFSGQGMVTFITLDGPDEGATGAQRDATAYVPESGACRLERVRYILADEGEWNTAQRLRVHVTDHTGNAAHAGVDVMIGQPP